MRCTKFPAERLKEFPVVTAQQMRTIDQMMLDISKITIIQMMERAGIAIAEVTNCYLTSSFPNVTILVGAGNNGGGALVAARILAGNGANIQVILAKPQNQLNEVPASQLEILAKMYPKQVHLNLTSHLKENSFPKMLKCDVIIDGLLGYSIHGDPGRNYADLIEMTNNSKAPVISVDLPSGLNPDTGNPGTPTIRATATVTLAAPKRGMTNSAAQPYLGELYLACIGISAEIINQVTTPEIFPRIFPRIMSLQTSSILQSGQREVSGP